jgi:fructosamine-3-kinase
MLWNESFAQTGLFEVFEWYLQNIYDKYKTLQEFKQHFLQNSLLVQLYTYASDCEGARNVIIL